MSEKGLKEGSIQATWAELWRGNKNEFGACLETKEGNRNADTFSFLINPWTENAPFFLVAFRGRGRESCLIS